MSLRDPVDHSDIWDGAEFRVPLHLLRVKVPVTAGMDPCVLLGMVPILRKTTQDLPPILVDDLCTPQNPCGSWRAQDGRHRFFAHVIAGRHDIAARLDPGGEHG